jgi:hypothetical protein
VSTHGSERIDTSQGVRPVGDSLSEDASLGELIGRLSNDFSRLMRAELALAKAEAKEEAVRAGRGAGMLTGAGIGALLVLVFGSLALMFGFGRWMALGWAALIVTVIWAVVAGALAASGRSALKAVNPALPRTTETLKEDAQWAKNPRG